MQVYPKNESNGNNNHLESSVMKLVNNNNQKNTLEKLHTLLSFSNCFNFLKSALMVEGDLLSSPGGLGAKTLFVEVDPD